MGKLIPNAFNLLVVIAVALGSTGEYFGGYILSCFRLTVISLLVWHGRYQLHDRPISILRGHGLGTARLARLLSHRKPDRCHERRQFSWLGHRRSLHYLRMILQPCL